MSLKKKIIVKTIIKLKLERFKKGWYYNVNKKCSTLMFFYLMNNSKGYTSKNYSAYI